MEMNSQNQEKPTIQSSSSCSSSCLTSIPAKVKSSIGGFIDSTKKIGEEDPRKVIHSAKVGLALTLVSFFYYFRSIYDDFGQNGLWAIVSVAVAFEFTVGGTLSRSINRGCATVVAGALGLGAAYLASVCGDKGEPILLALMVFSLAAFASFMRFLPKVKKYDYGLVMVIPTFSLVAVSGYQVRQILEFAHQRVSTILAGAAACIIVSVFVCPVWAGQDLHNSVAANIDKLATFLKGFGGDLSTLLEDDDDKNNKNVEKSFRTDYKSVLNSKASEELLASFAWWEPAHGRFRIRHPWKQYLKIGDMNRECACLLETLNANSKSLTTTASSSLHFQTPLQELCHEMSTECGKALKELASAVKEMRQPSQSTEAHVLNAMSAADRLKTMLETSSVASKADLQGIMPLLVNASVLNDVIHCVDKIAKSVAELSLKARFKAQQSTEKVLHSGIVNPVDDGGDQVVVEVRPPATDSPEKKSTHVLFTFYI